MGRRAEAGENDGDTAADGFAPVERGFARYEQTFDGLGTRRIGCLPRYDGCAVKEDLCGCALVRALDKSQSMSSVGEVNTLGCCRMTRSVCWTTGMMAGLG